MTTVVEINTLRRQDGLPLIRFDLRKYSERDLADLRLALEALYEISHIAAGDFRGFWAFARGHGYDQQLCHNDSRLFLAWHRAYLYSFERALVSAYQDAVEDPEAMITLPYWDWTVFDPETDAANGIPRALDDERYTTADGEERPNPLKAARSLYRIEALGLSGDDEKTVRYVQQLRGGIPALAAEVDRYWSERDFATFNEDIDFGAHGAIHVWVGGQSPDSKLPNRRGDLASVTSAAFDPIFWLHHCMVDRLWARWQRINGNATVSRHVLESALYGGFTGEEMLDHAGYLKYVYGTAPAAASAADAQVLSGTEEAPLPPTLTVRIEGLGQRVREARLHLQGMRPPLASYEVRVFAQPASEVGEIDAHTDMEGNPNFAGRLFFFGHGECFGAPGHCNPQAEERDAYDLRPKHPLRKRNYSLDITRAVQALAERATDERVRLSFVVLDGAGNQVAPEVLDFDHVTVVAD